MTMTVLGFHQPHAISAAETALGMRLVDFDGNPVDENHPHERTRTWLTDEAEQALQERLYYAYVCAIEELGGTVAPHPEYPNGPYIRVTINGQTWGLCKPFTLDEWIDPKHGNVLGVVLEHGKTPLYLDLNPSPIRDLDLQAVLIAIARRHIVQAVPAFERAAVYACSHD